MKHRNFAKALTIKSKRMAKFPFQLLIKSASSGNEESLLCKALLRSVPGSREVYDALWNNKKVILKLFSHRISARRHLKRDWEGLSNLIKLELNSPKPLFCGKTEDGRWAMVVEKIVHSSTALNVFQQTKEPTEKLDILITVCRELAKLHSKGVLQKDLHLGNFLLGFDKVFVLDPGQMRFLQREVDKKAGLSQLAMLAGYSTDSDIHLVEKLYGEYFSARNWHAEKPDMKLIQRQITAHRKRGIKRGLKKCLRTSKRTLRIKSENYLAVFDKGFYQGDGPLDFIEKVDALMDKGEILKKGGTSYVSRLMWNGKDVVVKRYNHKGLMHSLRHTIKKSRARLGWLHAHRLRMLQIPTPKPLAYIEQRKQKLVWQSYLVTEYVEGQKLYDFLRDSKTNKENHIKVISQVTKLLDKLGKYKTTHGDLKHSNILVTDNGIVLTDLDGMKVHKWNWFLKINRSKDLARFAKSLECRC